MQDKKTFSQKVPIQSKEDDSTAAGSCITDNELSILLAAHMIADRIFEQPTDPQTQVQLIRKWKKMFISNVDAVNPHQNANLTNDQTQEIPSENRK